MIVATVVTVVAGDCILDVDPVDYEGSQVKYERIENPEKDPIVRKIVIGSIALRNRPRNFGHRCTYVDDEHYVAYRLVRERRESLSLYIINISTAKEGELVLGSIAFLQFITSRLLLNQSINQLVKD